MPPMPSPENEFTVRVGLYIRVSTDKQALSGVSLEEQETRLRAGVARRPGWVVADLYRDDGYSGHDMDRPEVQRCLRDVAAGKLDVVLALDIDRAHRNEQNRRNFEKYLLDHNVEMVYEGEPEYDRLSVKHLSRGMQGLIAEWYSDKASETTRDKMVHMARTARRTGGPVPFGLAIGPDKRYVQDPEFFPILLQLFTRRSQGESVGSLTRWLTETGVPTPADLDRRRHPERRGRSHDVPYGAWSRTTVERILRNETYHGTLTYNRRYSKRFQHQAKSQDDIIRIEDAWERFVPDEIWYRCRLIDLETSGTRAGPEANSTFALSHLLRCARCGHGIAGWTATHYKNYKRGRVRYSYRKYRCAGRSESYNCDAPLLDAAMLEALVIREVAAYLRQNEGDMQRLYEDSAAQLEAYRRELAESVAASDTSARAQAAERAKLVQAVAGLVTRNASDELIAQMDLAIQRAGDAIRLAEAKRDLARAALQKLPDARLKLEAFRVSLDGLADRLQAADLAVQKRILADLVDHIDIDPEHHTATIYVRRLAAEVTSDLDSVCKPFSRGPVCNEPHILSLVYA